MNDFTISSNRHEIEFELILLITDLDHLINVFTNEMKLSNIASIIGTGIYGLLHLTVDDQFLINVLPVWEGFGSWIPL